MAFTEAYSNRIRAVQGALAAWSQYEKGSSQKKAFAPGMLLDTPGFNEVTWGLYLRRDRCSFNVILFFIWSHLLKSACAVVPAATVRTWAELSKLLHSECVDPPARAPYKNKTIANHSVPALFIVQPHPDSLTRHGPSTRVPALLFHTSTRPCGALCPASMRRVNENAGTVRRQRASRPLAS